MKVYQCDLDFADSVLEFWSKHSGQEKFLAKWTNTSLKDYISKACCLVKVEDNELVGVLIHGPAIAGEIEILQLLVAPESRSQGFAGELLFSLENSLLTAMASSEIDFFKIFLEVSENNLKAIHFYKRNDFREIGKRKAYYGNSVSALILEKQIKKQAHKKSF